MGVGRAVAVALVLLVVAGIAYYVFSRPAPPSAVPSYPSSTRTTPTTTVSEVYESMLPRKIDPSVDNISLELHLAPTILVETFEAIAGSHYFCDALLKTYVGTITTFEGRLATTALLCTNGIFLKLHGSEYYSLPFKVGGIRIKPFTPYEANIYTKRNAVLTVINTGKSTQLVVITFNTTKPELHVQKLNFDTKVFGATVDKLGTYIAVNLGTAIRVYNVLSARPLMWKTISGPPDIYGKTIRGDPHILRVDGRPIVVAVSNNAVYAWHINGSLLWSYTDEKVSFFGAEPSPDDKLIAVIARRSAGWEPLTGKYLDTGEYVYVFDTSNGKLLWISEVEGPLPTPFFVVWSPSGERLLVVKYTCAYVYTRNGMRLAVFTPSKFVIESAEWSPDERYVVLNHALLGFPVALTVIDLDSGIALASLSAAVDAGVTWLNNSMIMACSRGSIILHNIETGSIETVSAGEHALKLGIIIDPIAVYWIRGRDSLVAVHYTYPTAEIIVAEHSLDLSRTEGPWIYPIKLVGYGEIAAMSENDRYLAIAASHRYREFENVVNLVVIDAVSRAIVLNDSIKGELARVLAIDFSSNNRYLALLVEISVIAAQNRWAQLVVYDLLKGEQVYTIAPLSSSSSLLHFLEEMIDVAPDGKRVAYITEGYEVLIFDAETWNYFKLKLEDPYRLEWINENALLVAYGVPGNYKVAVVRIEPTNEVSSITIAELKADHVEFERDFQGNLYVLSASLSFREKNVAVNLYKYTDYTLEKVVTKSFNYYEETTGKFIYDIVDAVVSHNLEYAVIVLQKRQIIDGLSDPHSADLYLVNFKNGEARLLESLNISMRRLRIQIDISLDDSKIMYTELDYIAIYSALKAMKIVGDVGWVTNIYWLKNGSRLALAGYDTLCVYDYVNGTYRFVWGLKSEGYWSYVHVVNDKILVSSTSYAAAIYDVDGNQVGVIREKEILSPSTKYFVAEYYEEGIVRLAVFDYNDTKILDLPPKLRYVKATHWTSDTRLYMLATDYEGAHYLIMIDLEAKRIEEIPLPSPDPAAKDEVMLIDSIMVVDNNVLMYMHLAKTAYIVKFDLAKREYVKKWVLPEQYHVDHVDLNEKYIVIPLYLRDTLNSLRILILDQEFNVMYDQEFYGVKYPIFLPITWVNDYLLAIGFDEEILALLHLRTGKLKPIAFSYAVVYGFVSPQKDVVLVLLSEKRRDGQIFHIYFLELQPLIAEIFKSSP